MRSFSSSFACRQPRRTAPPQVIGDATSDRDLVAWARDVVAHPQRHGATRRESAVVATLLVDLEAESAERTWCWDCGGSGKRYAGNGRWDTCQACGGSGLAR